MLELGGVSEKAHALVLHDAMTRDLDRFFLFGAGFEKSWFSLRENDKKNRLYWTDSFSSLAGEIKKYVQEGDLVMLKGSRGIELERLVPVLTNTLM
jgi:UDP-N-acetylmuramoyl-tripeptide--D-alanyl-D-alanine ligase